MPRILPALLLAGLLGAGCNGTPEPSAPPLADAEDAVPPMARVQPVELEKHGHVRTDDYYWLRERDDPAVIAYLEAENAYTEAMTAHTRALREALFEEIKGRIVEDDASVPVRLGDYYYYDRYEEGRQYPIYARRKGSLDATEEVILDANALAEGHAFFSARLSPRTVSPDHRWLAYSIDTVGRRFYTLHFKNLETGETLETAIPNVTGNLAWANDNRTVFYTKQDPETLRWHRVYRHTVGTDPAGDVLVYEEADETFSAFVRKSKSGDFLFIGASQTLADEYHYLDADHPEGAFEVLHPRERGLEYSPEHFGNYFYLRTNEGGATNFKLVRTSLLATPKSHWEEVLPHRDDVYLQGFEIFRDHLVLAERAEGLTQLRIRPWDGGEEHYIDFGEPAYLAYIDANPAFDTGVLRYGYTSLTTPRSVYDYDMAARERTLLKQDEILGGFSPGDYAAERIYATARDGARVPVSLVYHKDTPRDGTAPVLVYGYGSYGSSRDATFSAARLSLLDRGFVYAIAHVRGGQEMGRAWYEDGKLLKKMNTFTDFIDAADHLVDEGYADSARVFAQGGSAGGLLMGAVVNLRPDRWRGVIAEVPFVDVITTMLDDSIPLTTSEYDEWGNPNVQEYYDYILSYSPYDNVEAKGYPAMLVTAGLHDSQVQYWEPAKWVARLRAMKTDANPLLLKTNMEAGHGGASGRYERYRETAFEYAFLLDLAGLSTVEQPRS